MQQNRINILSTRPLDDSLIREARQQDIDIDILSFIKTEGIQTSAVREEIKKTLPGAATVVFTSMNAVEAVVNQLQQRKSSWKIYCVGATTATRVKKYFGDVNIRGIGESAAELAELIIKKKETDITFFCSDQRRDELPDILQKNRINVNEIVVYRTIATPHTIEKEYRGILYFSPSAVESFFSVNKLSANTILFAIGNTTANEIVKYSTNKIIVSDETGKDMLVRKMIAHFINSE
jgi:uroporphyrinogen-III synthase